MTGEEGGVGFFSLRVLPTTYDQLYLMVSNSNQHFQIHEKYKGKTDTTPFEKKNFDFDSDPNF